MGIFGEDRVYSSQVPGPADLFPVKNDKCCKFIKFIREQIKDEEKAVKEYGEASVKIQKIFDKIYDPESLPGWAEGFFSKGLSSIVEDESNHKNHLQVMEIILKKICNCK